MACALERACFQPTGGNGKISAAGSTESQTYAADGAGKGTQVLSASAEEKRKAPGKMIFLVLSYSHCQVC